MQTNNPKAQAMTKRQLAALYKVSEKTLGKWLEPHAEAIGPLAPRCYLYTPAQVEIIFEKIGTP